jgi:hypothetical protein
MVNYFCRARSKGLRNPVLEHVNTINFKVTDDESTSRTTRTLCNPLKHSLGLDSCLRYLPITFHAPQLAMLSLVRIKSVAPARGHALVLTEHDEICFEIVTCAQPTPREPASKHLADVGSKVRPHSAGRAYRG